MLTRPSGERRANRRWTSVALAATALLVSAVAAIVVQATSSSYYKLARGLARTRAAARVLPSSS
jgi:hypothetical protein